MWLSGQNLGHHFGDGPPLFSGLQFTIGPGSVVGLVGPSGSGKSTLLGIMAGWIDPTDGVVLRQGLDRINWVFQSPAGVARRTALDHVVLPLVARGAQRGDAEAHAHELLAQFGLDRQADAQFADLSGGEAQRLMLARSMAADPSLLLVDEPTAQLDSVTGAVVIAHLRSLAARARLVVVATHDHRARASCDSIIELGGI